MRIRSRQKSVAVRSCSQEAICGLTQRPNMMLMMMHDDDDYSDEDDDDDVDDDDDDA